MSTIERMTITVPSEMAAILRQSVDGGEYASTSEVVREAIRLGDESGSSIPAETVFAELRDVIARRRAQG